MIAYIGVARLFVGVVHPIVISVVLFSGMGCKWDMVCGGLRPLPRIFRVFLVWKWCILVHCRWKIHVTAKSKTSKLSKFAWYSSPGCTWPLTPLGYAYKAIIAYHAYSSHSAHAILNCDQKLVDYRYKYSHFWVGCSSTNGASNFCDLCYLHIITGHQEVLTIM